jgi:FkbM family methyltransferase
MNRFFKMENDHIYIPSNIKKVKLDIGLSINAPHSCIWLKNDPDDLLVFGFEPNPESVLSIKDINYFQNNTVKKNKELEKYIEPVHYFKNHSLIGTKLLIAQCALGLETTNKTLYVTDVDPGCSSTFKLSSEFMKMRPVEKEINVEQYRLDEFFKIFPFHQIPYIDYIKIDAQGADLDIIKSGGEYIKKYVVYVTLEPENEEYLNTENDFSSMKSYMESIGFIYIHHNNTRDPTFINSNFIHLKDEIFISQNG